MASSAVSRARATTALALAAASAAAAVDVPYTPTPQLADQLCWAAATQMVVDALNPHPLDLDEPYQIAAQAWLARTDPNFPAKVAACKADIVGNCNRAFYPILHEMGFDYLDTNGQPSPSLTQDQLTTELDQGRPIIFGWQYDNSSASGLHFMLIAGYYHTATGKLRLHIYDPLPVKIGSAQTISYDNYTVATPYDLHNDMGKPYAQSFNYYDIHLTAGARPSPPSNLEVNGAASGTARGLALHEAIRTSRPIALAELKHFDGEDYSPQSDQPALLEVGDPFPIVALGLDELRAATGQPAAQLLRQQTGVVLYPVELAGIVRDSFLLIRRGDSWVRGGFSNTTVTRLLVESRQQRAKSPAQRSGYYLLSVPALAAFFLAQGSGNDTTLIPVSSDPAILADGRPIEANQPYPAQEVLTGLINAALHYRDPGTVRPAPQRERPAAP